VEPFGIFLVVLLSLLAIFGVAALGFGVLPKPYPPPAARSRPGELRPFDDDLPEPVRRHFAETLGGEAAAAVDTVLVWGRGRVCLSGVWMPLRFKSYYRPGRDSLRVFEVTWYGQTLLSGRERYQDGVGSIELGGRIEGGPGAAQANNLALWAEAAWFPVVLVTGLGTQVVQGPPESDWQERVPRWEPVDDSSARLIIPLRVGDDLSTDQLTVHFDPLSGRMTHLSGLRARGEETGEPWRVDLLAWEQVAGITGPVPDDLPVNSILTGSEAVPGSALLPVQIAVGWGESGAIGAYWTLEGVAYNVDIPLGG
jgi:hypothetical protein